MIIQLPHCEALLHPETFCVTTRFPDGKEAVGQRLPTPENAADARELGYEGSDERVCWMAGAEHEVLHGLIWHWVEHKPSPVLLHVAGIEECPLHTRWYEESIVLAFQKWYNTGEEDAPVDLLFDNLSTLPNRRQWHRAAFEPYRKIIEQAWEERT